MLQRSRSPAQRSESARYAALIRWRGRDAVPVQYYSQTVCARLMRYRRAIARRMAQYDGVRYDDRMASSPRVRAALEHLAESDAELRWLLDERARMTAARGPR